jgi:hypothetical protein
MRLAIMQPYILPYFNYFKLINKVDLFIIYDDVNYTKNGWINSNYILSKNGEKKKFTIPLSGASQNVLISNILIADNEYKYSIKKLEKFIKFNYENPDINDILKIFNKDQNSFVDLAESLIFKIMNLFDIKTEIIRSSSLSYDKGLKGQDKIINICKLFNAKKYFNLPGGIEIYDEKIFNYYGIELNLLPKNHFIYNQKNDQFVPNLSILDYLLRTNNFTDFKKFIS